PMRLRDARTRAVRSASFSSARPQRLRDSPRPRSPPRTLRNATSRQAFDAFLEILDDDARKARAALRLALAQKSISSQLVDNLNASIPLRALLTDVFLIDEALKGGVG